MAPPIRADTGEMHSWVFRHRERLRVVFGLPAPEVAAPESEPVAAQAGEPEKSSRRENSGARPRYAPGTLHRTTRYVVLSPMPRTR